jgi:hypothetical protein
MCWASSGRMARSRCGSSGRRCRAGLPAEDLLQPDGTLPPARRAVTTVSAVAGSSRHGRNRRGPHCRCRHRYRQTSQPLAPLRPACYSPTLTEPGNEFYATQSGVLARADQAELEYIGLELFEGLSTSPSGERLSTMQFGWHWDDNPDAPIKFRVFAQQSPWRYARTRTQATSPRRSSRCRSSATR